MGHADYSKRNMLDLPTVLLAATGIVLAVCLMAIAIKLTWTVVTSEIVL